jgi:hypothetical protein
MAECVMPVASIDRPASKEVNRRSLSPTKYTPW